MSFFAELKRRNVFKVGVAYAIVAWLLIQVAETILPTFNAPQWVLQTVIFLLILGFPLAVFLAWVYELTPEGIKVTTSEGPDQYHTQTTGQRLNYFIIGVLILVVTFLLVKDYVLKESPETAKEISNPSTMTEIVSPEKEVKETTEPAAPPNSIAVLPLTNMSEDKGNEYFADGIAEEILNSLARISELEVRGRTSSFYFKDRNEDLHTISKMLNVKYILEGSIRKAGKQVRITVQLISTQTDEHVWSKTYERTMDDIFTIQEDIARSVADTLQVTLGVGELGRVPGMTRNINAYDAYLIGHSFSSQIGRENNSRAIEHLEQAVALDPDFAIAWTDLVSVYTNARDAFITERAEEFAAKREVALSRVLELVPEADYALRIKAARSGDLVEVERLWKQALAQSPTNFDANAGYGNFLRNVGRPREALDYYQRAVRIEPLSSVIHFNLSLSYDMSGNPEAAEVALIRARELTNQPALIDATLLVMALEENNRALINKYVKLVVNTELLGNINPTETRDINQVMDGLLDTPEAAGVELRKFAADPVYNNMNARVGISIWASYFGENELALNVIKDFSEIPSWAIFRPIQEPIRKLPGFKNLMIKAGLVDYWRKTGNWGDFCHPAGESDFECE